MIIVRILRYEIVTRFKLERKQTKAIRYKAFYAWNSNIDLWWIGQTKEKYREVKTEEYRVEYLDDRQDPSQRFLNVLRLYITLFVVTTYWLFTSSDSVSVKSETETSKSTILYRAGNWNVIKLVGP